jgi:peptide subunit release factor 1 (eRF1)
MGIVNVLMAGPGFRKREMVEDGCLDYRLRVTGIQDAEYTDDVAGPREAISRWKSTSNHRLEDLHAK